VNERAVPDFRRLLAFSRPYAGRVALAIACMFLGAGLSAVSIGALQPIFDLLFPSGGSAPGLSLPDGVRALLGGAVGRWQAAAAGRPLEALSLLCGVLAVAFLVKAGLTYAHQYLMQSVAERIMTDLRERAYGHLHGLSLAFFTRRSTGELMTRVTTDIDLLGRSLTAFFSNGVREPIQILGFLGLLFLIKWPLALLVLLTVPVAAFPIVRFGKKMRARSHRVQERRAELNTILQETIAGIRIVKAFGMEDYERGRFREKSRELLRGMIRMVKVDSLASPVLEILGSFGVVGAVWLGGVLVLRRVLTPGELMAFLGALASLYQPVKRLSQVNLNVQRGLAGARRVFEILDTRPDIRDAPAAPRLPRMREGVTFHGVTFGYEPGRLVLEGLDFSAKLGEIVAVVGASGSGKTTLVNLIPRFYDPLEGWIEIDGHDIRTVNLRSLREQMGIVTQDTILFDDTIFDNVAYGRRDMPPERVEAAARVANADEFIRALPEGYRTRIGERGVRLSGGQRQRLAIARAIVNDPPILILDEATSALDAEAERLVQEALDRVVRNRTTFVIAHRLSTVVPADKILVLKEGRIAERGTHAELVARRGIYYDLTQRQRTAPKS
jgi:subfamily B ATP-binding cassette protein MsbA